MNATEDEVGGGSSLLSTACFSGGGGLSASGSTRRISGDTEVTSIVESLSMEVGQSEEGKVDEEVGSGINLAS
jgi:hypothetical protein